jgi:hypothetical protein
VTSHDLAAGSKKLPLSGPTHCCEEENMAIATDQIYRFVVRRLKILDGATLGEAVFVSADVIGT